MKNGITVHELDDSLKKVLDDLKKSANDDQARKDINKIRDDIKSCISSIDVVSKKANNNENNFNAQIKKYNEDIVNINSQYNNLPNKFTLKCAGAVDNFNNMLTQNEYTVGGTNIPNAPYSGQIYGKLIVIVSTGDTHNNKNNWLWQYFISTTNNEIYKRSKVNANAWSQWEKVVTRKEIEDLKTHVGNGKNDLYAAITDKKITPKSKDFADLVQGIKSIKLGQGNAQASQVLEDRTFTNDNGIVQKGTMKNYGDKVITPSKDMQTLNNGFYNSIKVNAIDINTLKNNFPELKPENIIEGINIGGIIGTKKDIVVTPFKIKEEISPKTAKTISVKCKKEPRIFFFDGKSEFGHDINGRAIHFGFGNIDNENLMYTSNSLYSQSYGKKGSGNFLYKSGLSESYSGAYSNQIIPNKSSLDFTYTNLREGSYVTDWYNIDIQGIIISW